MHFLCFIFQKLSPRSNNEGEGVLGRNDWKDLINTDYGVCLTRSERFYCLKYKTCALVLIVCVW